MIDFGAGNTKPTDYPNSVWQSISNSAYWAIKVELKRGHIHVFLSIWYLSQKTKQSWSKKIMYTLQCE